MDIQHILGNLPTEKTNEDRAQRKKMFSSFDPNGNGVLSLAEVDKGIRDVLKCDDLFNCKPAIMRAFQHAKNAVKSRRGSQGDDYVELREFRYLLLSLKQYFSYYQMFDAVDKDDDRRVTVNEFMQAQDLIESFGVKFDDPREEFNKIDTNGGGMILFDEFSHYCIEKSLSMEEDDEEE